MRDGDDTAATGTARPDVEGEIHPDFGPVGDRFERLLPRSGHGGAALAIWHRGECVVDCWGGSRNDAGAPWQHDTLALSFSTTKGVASTLVHVLVDRGLLDYDTAVAHYWPEFAEQGKEAITIRQLMTHGAGLHRIRHMIEHPRAMLDWNKMTGILASRAPVFTPGSANAYHGLTYGWLVGELVVRVTGLSFADALRSYVADPLDLDGLYCGLPQEQLGRRAQLQVPERLRNPGVAGTVLFWWWAWVIATLTFWRISLFETADALLPKHSQELDWGSDEVARASIPAANGHFTARSLARLYATLAEGGALGGRRLLSEETLRRATEIQTRRRDRVLHIPMHWRLGYHRVFSWPGPRSQGFGHYGFGGSGGWADPQRRIGFGFTVNHGIGTPVGDSRVVALAGETLRCADRR